MSAPIDSWLEAVLSGEPLDTIISRFAEMGSGTPAEQIISSKTFNKRTIREVLVLAQIVTECGPITLRGAFYRAVSAGVYPDTDEKHYRQCGRLILKLRREGFLDYSTIVDSTRRRLKPSSWSGLGDYADTIAHAYRRDLWSRQDCYVEVFVEKDAMAAVIEPVTADYDIHLNVIRGCVSETFVFDVAEQWKEIEKPIYVYYLGDHDPSGLMIEKDLEQRLREFSGRAGASLDWQRLAIDSEDFEDETVLGFPIKGDRRRRPWQTKHRKYLDLYGDRCVEVDAIAPDQIRERIREAIESHIDQVEWAKLKDIELIERDTVRKTFTAPAWKAT